MAENVFHNTGDFRGAFVPQASPISNAGTMAGTIGAADDTARTELKALLAQLGETLKALPAPRTEDAQAVEASAEGLLTEAAAEKPNRPLLRIKGSGLLEAAKGIAQAAPGALSIAGKIVDLIGKIHGLG